MRRAEAGIALLEALVALAILATAGLALAAVTSAGLRAEADARARERTLVAEQRVLTAMSLLGRSDLDRRLGHRALGAFDVTVERPEPTLYRIALADTVAPDVEALVTVVYRPEPPHGP